MEHIILLHGALGAAATMYPLSKALERSGALHLLDFSGHGERSGKKTPFDLPLFEQDILHFLDARDIESAHFFGYSLGGYVALRLAISHPHRIKSITTLATKFDWNEATCRHESDKLNAAILEEKAPRFVSSLKKLHQHQDWKELVANTSQFLLSMYQHRFSPVNLAEIKVPVCLLVGEKDKMVGLQETLDTAQAINMAQFGVLPGCTHPIEQVDLDVLSALIAGFIRRQHAELGK
ncbi:MAG: alpha/beta fold hydrolase [Bacteroidetes bacterium]|nr:alpha/beta fold hydrolase [Bacteroidota bacterium]